MIIVWIENGFCLIVIKLSRWDLFHMKRYWSDGEENEDEPQNEQNAEADILNKLKNKVGTVFQKNYSDYA